ncbi:MAG: DUF2304 domain-containing protein [Lachnospiraceae bacterium]
MSPQLRVIIAVVVVLYLITVIFLIRRNHFRIKYSLLWLFSGIIMLLLVVFPQILFLFADLCGIEVPVNGLVSVIIFCLILIIMSLTGALSKLSENSKTMSQKLGILEERVRELENRDEKGCEKENS